MRYDEHRLAMLAAMVIVRHAWNKRFLGDGTPWLLREYTDMMDTMMERNDLGQGVPRHGWPTFFAVVPVER
ncbi:hypothetical protein [Paraeggerthella sp.]|uniref:hypothetical protein n=1 Tax=Paraeggerthella sp. TaxID=2897350 RepID=UPI003528319C